jgi:hypothetical protein
VNPPLPEWEQLIQRLQRLSVELFELAQAGDWEAVSESEAQRRAVLDELFRQPTPDAIAPLLKDAIGSVLSSDAHLLELARGEMGKISDNLKLIQQGRRAMRVYRDF